MFEYLWEGLLYFYSVGGGVTVSHSLNPFFIWIYILNFKYMVVHVSISLAITLFYRIFNYTINICLILSLHLVFSCVYICILYVTLEGQMLFSVYDSWP